VKLSAPLAPGMVLQRNMPAAIWGVAKPGEAVTVTFAGQTKKSKAKPGPRGIGRLLVLMNEFTTMYRPHAARETTVLLPLLRGLVGPKRYEEMGEQFEQTEHRILGAGGFGRIVAAVAQIETALGIHDLAAYTPATSASPA